MLRGYEKTTLFLLGEEVCLIVEECLSVESSSKNQHFHLLQYFALDEQQGLSTVSIC